MLADMWKRGLTIIQILWLRIVCPPCNGKLDLFKALAFDTCPLLKPLLRVGKFLALVVALADNVQRDKQLMPRVHSPPQGGT